MATAAAPQSSPVHRLALAARLARRTLAETAAVVQVGVGTLLVLAAAERRSVLSSANHGAFTGWFAGPLRGLLPGLSRSPDVLHRDLRVALAVMLGAWLVVLAGGRTVRPAVILSTVAALHAVFLLAPPFALTDVFNYIGYARLDVAHHANPYVQLPLLNRGDPVYAYSNWHRLRSPYGPLFTLLLIPVAALPLPVAYWLYKVLATAASLGLLALVWTCARRLGRPPAAAVAFVGLNPLVLVYALGGKHNDLIMMACVLAAAALVLARREVLGGAALVAAVAIKASAGLMLPIVALAAPRRWRAVAGVAAGVVGIGLASLLAFGAHLPDVADQNRLVNTYSVVNLIGFAAGRGGADATVHRIATIVLVAGVLTCAAVAWRTRRWVTPAGFAGLLGVLTVGWLEPWYVLWALPFAALSRSRALRLAAVVMTAWLAFVWSGLGPQIATQHGIHVSHTAVARADRRVTASFLYDHGPAH
jgi:hypothetical protein